MPFKTASIFEKAKTALRNFYRAGRNRTAVFFIQVFSVLAVGILIIFFMTGTLKKQVSKIRETRASVSQIQGRISSLNELKQQYLTIENDTSRFYSLLVNVDDMGDPITQLDALADDFALQVTTKIGDRSEDPNGAYIPVTISTVSSLDTLKRYMFALEQLPFLVQVDALDFSGGFNTVSGALIRLKLFTR